MTRETRERLVEEDPQFQRLTKKHRELSDRLAELQQLRHPNETERLEETQLKKLKLALKDQMEEMVSRAEN